MMERRNLWSSLSFCIKHHQPVFYLGEPYFCLGKLSTLFKKDPTYKEIFDVPEKDPLGWFIVLLSYEKKPAYFEVIDSEDPGFHLRTKGPSGWLDRRGRFYECGWSMHLEYALERFKKDGKELESLGWVHLDSRGHYSFNPKGNFTKLTQDQKRFLEANLIKVEDPAEGD